MPDVVLLELPTGATVRTCAECAMEPPRHQYFCAAVRRYSRSRILREMVRVQNEIAALEKLIAELGGDEQLERDMLAAYGVDGRGAGPTTPVIQHDRELRILRFEFWDWAWWIGCDVNGATREARDDLKAEVEETRQRIKRKLLEDAAA